MPAKSALIRALLCMLIALTSQTAAQVSTASRGPSLATRLKACAGDKAALSSRAKSCTASLAKSQKKVKQLAPAGSKLAGCNKVGAALSVKLSATTGALKKCNANNAELNQQLMASKRRGLVSARSAGASLASEDVGAAAAARIAELEAAGQLLEVQLAKARADIQEMAADLEDTYMLMGQAQNEMYAALELGVDGQDVLHDCLMESIGNQTALNACSIQRESASASRGLFRDQLTATNAVYITCLADLSKASVIIAELTETQDLTRSEDEGPE